MPTASTKAFILDSTPFGEQDKLVYLLTQDQGILKGIAPGSLKSKNRFGALFELFTKGHFFYYWNEEKELITLSKGDILTSHFNTVSRPENIFYFYVISEIILKLVPYQQKDEKIFRLLNSILENRKTGIRMDLLLVYFLIWILRIEGMMFNPSICYNCFAKNGETAWLKTDFRGILCAGCKSNETLKLNRDELLIIQWSQHNSPEKIEIWTEKINLPKLIQILVKKVENHAECSIKSKRFLPQFK
jgi:DNA repair protein RecO (recombination protein O)